MVGSYLGSWWILRIDPTSQDLGAERRKNLPVKENPQKIVGPQELLDGFDPHLSRTFMNIYCKVTIPPSGIVCLFRNPYPPYSSCHRCSGFFVTWMFITFGMQLIRKKIAWSHSLMLAPPCFFLVFFCGSCQLLPVIAECFIWCIIPLLRPSPPRNESSRGCGRYTVSFSRSCTSTLSNCKSYNHPFYCVFNVQKDGQ